ncbi:MAG: CotS family spore coat protein [Dorea sp.]|nr:CotS family spore coat protein [Dorea sp.]
MQDYDRNILEKYNIDVNSTRKVRGAVLCDTSRGVFLLKEVSAPAGRILSLCELYAHLMEHGYDGVDYIEPNADGDYITDFEDGKKYMLRRWFRGRECDLKKPAELLEASGNLAKLHMIMRVKLSQGTKTERLCQEYERHDRELRKVRRFVRSQTSKGEFEIAFLKHFDAMYQWAQIAGDMLAKSDYERLYQESAAGNCLTHGEYNYHNILMKSEEMYGSAAQILATTNFDKFKQDIQVEDLYYFFRKVMEKHGWKERLGDNMLNAYSAICPLSDTEMEYLKIRLAYPEKFWKIANSYYHSNKAWISVKNVEKLNTAIRQTKEKERFMENIFAFHL